MSRSGFCALSLIFLLGRQAPAADISDADRAYLLAHLEMTRQFVMDATRGFSKDQWLFKPAPLRWSIAQCVDHLAQTEAYVLKMVRERVLPSQEPLRAVFASLSKGREAALGKPHLMSSTDDAVVMRWMTDRVAAIAEPVEQRSPITEVAPRAEFADPLSALDDFLKARAATIEYIKTTKDDLRGHFTQVLLAGFPDVRFQDGYQWLLRMSAHTERHLMQVQEVRQNPAFPINPR
jgi:hypothetical protein